VDLAGSVVLYVSCGGARPPEYEHWPPERAAEAVRRSFDHVRVSTIDYVLDVLVVAH